MSADSLPGHGAGKREVWGRGANSRDLWVVSSGPHAHECRRPHRHCSTERGAADGLRGAYRESRGLRKQGPQGATLSLGHRTSLQAASGQGTGLKSPGPGPWPEKELPGWVVCGLGQGGRGRESGARVCRAPAPRWQHSQAPTASCQDAAGTGSAGRGRVQPRRAGAVGQPSPRWPGTDMQGPVALGAPPPRQLIPGGWTGGSSPTLRRV